MMLNTEGMRSRKPEGKIDLVVGWSFVRVSDWLRRELLSLVFEGLMSCTPKGGK